MKEKGIIKGIWFLLFIILFYSGKITGKEGQITGKVVDSRTKKPVEYATVTLSDTDGKLITGTITQFTGQFVIEDINYGTYKLTISFLGYDDINFDNIILSNNSLE